MPQTVASVGRPLRGHPKGLFYLALTEFWERFSYYGMSSLLVLYMVQELLHPGRVERIAGFAQYRAAVEELTGPLSVQSLAYQTFGLYSGLVYLTPLIGGFVADRLLGIKRTVLLGALLLSAGHFAMAFDQSFLLALLLLIAGSGCLKGNISAQVGDLYSDAEESRRTQGFAVFTMGVNLGAVCGPLACALLAQLYGWHIGFGAAGVVMVSATLIYAAGQPHLPARRQSRAQRKCETRLTTEERRRVMLLLMLIGLTVFQNASQFQFFSAGFVWLAAKADLGTPFGSVPIAWFLSFSSFAGVVAVPPLVARWARQDALGTEPSAITKIAVGSALFTIASALLAVATLLAGGGRSGILLPLVAYAVKGVGFIYFWPTLLAYVSAAAPRRVVATMVGTAFGSLFLGNVTGGWVGHFYEHLSPAGFWWLNSLIGGVGTMMLIGFGGMIDRALARTAVTG